LQTILIRFAVRQFAVGRPSSRSSARDRACGGSFFEWAGGRSETAEFDGATILKIRFAPNFDPAPHQDRPTFVKQGAQASKMIENECISAAYGKFVQVLTRTGIFPKIFTCYVATRAAVGRRTLGERINGAALFIQGEQAGNFP
jgi:hypothetical protein